MNSIQTLISNDTYIIILNRPLRGNALDMDMIDEISMVFREINRLETIRYVIIKANGKSFCSGADLNWMADAVHLIKEENLAECNKLADLYAEISECTKICIAQVQGPCIGGGMGLISACDFNFASTESLFSFSEVKLGLIPATVAPYVINRIGEPKARGLMLSGESISPEEALRIGLIDKVCDNSVIDREIENWIELLRLGKKGAQQKIKEFLKTLSAIESKSKISRFTAEALAEIRISSKAGEGIQEYLNKKSPVQKDSRDV